MSVAFDAHGEIVPSRGTTYRLLSRAGVRAGEIERAAAVVEQRLEHASLTAIERPLEVDEMLEANRGVGDRGLKRAQLGP